MAARGRDSRKKRARKASRKRSTLNTRLAWSKPALEDFAAAWSVETEGMAAATTGLVIVNVGGLGSQEEKRVAAGEK